MCVPTKQSKGSTIVPHTLSVTLFFPFFSLYLFYFLRVFFFVTTSYDNDNTDSLDGSSIQMDERVAPEISCQSSSAIPSALSISGMMMILL